MSYANEHLENLELKEDVKFLLSFAPDDCPDGLDPAFYITGTYKGDKEINDRVALIRKKMGALSGK